jgi:hypothetical protein
MAGLIDDPLLFFPTERDFNGDGNPDMTTEDYNSNGVFDYGLPGAGVNDVSHDWWLDFMEARDGRHAESGLVLPGQPAVMINPGAPDVQQVAGSRPFRSLTASKDLAGLAANATNAPNRASPIEDSLFRSHPDNNSTRGLFDLGNASETNSNSLQDFVRRRILSKIAGNTTNRSNVFVVFISVQFHEAVEDSTTGAVRIGGRIDLNNDGLRDDGHRGFFIVDRSAAEEAYDPRTGKFDWRVLIKHRLTIN